MNIFGITICRTSRLRELSAVIDCLRNSLRMVDETNANLVTQLNRYWQREAAQKLYGSTAPKNPKAAARKAAQNIHNNER